MKILSPAKINLFLHVTGKRPDSYHNLVSLMCCVDLYDTVFLHWGVDKISIDCNALEVPADETNLACRAARLFLKTLDVSEGVEIRIEKKIPVAAGLGGGSSNAAAVFLGLNRHYGDPFTRDQLMSMGRSLGADVPFFIFNRPAIASGIGEKLEAYNKIKKFKVLLIYPGFGVATATVYKNLNLGLTKCKKKLRSILLNKNEFNAESHLCNDLETVAASDHPEILAAKEMLLSLGATGALMSGSGPTVFGLFIDSDKARNAHRALSQHKTWQRFIANIITEDTEYIIQNT
ncbi:MAG: 4-(cytidine 5'-diphospho)-2-C-methyl-D-erythritol kinase [Deltaproteobacteria bacterium]|nr:4-(cytidine 5'-diphospho)-2-C-methyl-D-erythritol kinase [Deltaproteobacteria bacterium]